MEDGAGDDIISYDKDYNDLRFLQWNIDDVLPPGFKRIRDYGLLASARKREQLARCRQALRVPQPDSAVIDTVAAFFCSVSGR